MKKIFQIVLCLSLLSLSIWLIWPGRNVFGNAIGETLIAQCETGSSLVRLYQGDGGATVSYYWSITSQNKSSPFEWQVFYTYSNPVIDSINCVGDKVVALEDEKVVTEILPEIISNPAIDRVPGIYRGQAMFRNRNPLFKFSSLLGLIVLVPVFFILRRQR